MLGTFGSGLMLKHIFIISVIHSCKSSRKEENYRNKRVLMEKVVFSRCVVGNFLFIFDADLIFLFLMY